jgi:hypothetical protein
MGDQKLKIGIVCALVCACPFLKLGACNAVNNLRKMCGWFESKRGSPFQVSEQTHFSPGVYTPLAVISARTNLMIMNLLVILIVLMLLFGGGGFYLGGPMVGGGGFGLILLVLLVLFLTGNLSRR